MRILFKCSKKRVTSPFKVLQVLKIFAKICFVQRTMQGPFHQHFINISRIINVEQLCYAIQGSTNVQNKLASFYSNFNFFTKREKKDKFSIGNLNSSFIYVMNITNCYEFDFKLRFVTKSNPKFYRSKPTSF